MKYKTYFTQEELAEIFGITAASFRQSTAKDRYIRAVNTIISIVESRAREELKEERIALSNKLIAFSNDIKK